MNQALLDTNGQDLSTSPVHFNSIKILDFLAGYRAISCCNGIICLQASLFAGNRFCLWNPLIRQLEILSFPHPRISEYRIGNWTLMLFGYEYVSNDYKVIRILYDKYRGNFPIVQVYSSNAACFNEFHAPVLKHLMGSMQMVGNMQMENKLTDMARTNIVIDRILYFDGGDVLVSFDLHDEVFRLVQFPSLIRRRKRSDVLDFEGSLAMVFESGRGVVDRWTLDHVSKEVSWTKKFSFGNGLDDLETKIWLSCYLGAGQFYGTKLLNGNCFLYEVLYDYEKKKETQCYGLLEYFANHILRHATYKYMETLVSLDGFEQVENVRKEML